MRLALVFNPFSYKLHEENLRIVQRFFGLFPPLSLCWVSAIAKRAGHESIIVDARTEGLTMAATAERLRAFKPDVIGFMMTTYMFRETLVWVQYLKQQLRVPVLVGGYNLRVYPEASIAAPEIDFGVVNSSLITLPALLDELGGARRFADVPGLVYKKENGEIVRTPDPEQREKFSDYPFPDRSTLPNHLYEEFPTERKNFTVMVTSKGCPRSCMFCEAGRTPHDPRTPAQVVDEMELCYRDYDVREIDIFDYEFAINKKRTLEICRLMGERRLDLLWACRSRIDSIDEDVARAMAKAGCGRIYFGIESGDQQTLDLVNKGINVRQVRDTIAMVKSYGIKPLGFFLVAVPGETRRTFRETVRFAKSLDLDYVQFSKLTAKPLTGMWREMTKDGGYDYWREYILGNAAEATLPRPWTKLTNAEIDSMTKWAYLSFHLRPSFLWRSTLRVRSLNEFIRKARALFEMIFSQEKISERWLKKRKRFREYHPLIR